MKPNKMQSFLPGDLIEVHPDFRRYGVQLFGYPLELEEKCNYWKNAEVTPPDVGPLLLVKIVEKLNGNEQYVVLYDGRLYIADRKAEDCDDLPTEQWRKFKS